MAATPDTATNSLRRRAPDRRGVLAGVGAWLASGVAKAGGRARIVTMLGDSITAGFGLPAADALPAQLARALSSRGLDAVVRAAGVSGDTSADALARVGFSVQPDTDVCVVALGGNDLLQGLDPAALRANLAAIVARLKARGITVVLAGMRAPPAIGAGYAKAFDAVYPALARAEHVALYPYLLDGVALDPRLNQKDSIHPNAAGARIIAARLAPVVAQALAAHGEHAHRRPA
jgi:acyl-CoA thioesterase-1